MYMRNEDYINKGIYCSSASWNRNYVLWMITVSNNSYKISLFSRKTETMGLDFMYLFNDYDRHAWAQAEKNWIEITTYFEKILLRTTFAFQPNKSLFNLYVSSHEKFWSCALVVWYEDNSFSKCCPKFDFLEDSATFISSAIIHSSTSKSVPLKV